MVFRVSDANGSATSAAKLVWIEGEHRSLRSFVEQELEDIHRKLDDLMELARANGQSIDWLVKAMKAEDGA